MMESMAEAPLILIGGGGHALVVAEAAELAGLAVAGFLDDAAAAPLVVGRPSCRCLGMLADLDKQTGRACILAVGDLSLRRRLIAKIKFLTPASVIHPRAIVSPSATIGRGVYIGPGAIVHTRATIADHAIINSGCVIEHEVAVGENAHIAPRACVGGRAKVGPDSLVGLGSSVLPGMVIGRSCVVGSGAAVVKNVPDRYRVAGIPARPLE